jgi:N-acetylglucosaminyldiphosphoundecaprenol N-acetyl-beta-D-mannosaminyltransferase
VSPVSSVEFLGLSFAALDMQAVIRHCLEWCAGPRRSQILLTANASHLCMARSDSALNNACRAGDMVVADGMSVVWALRALGTPVPERVAGVDLMSGLLEAGGRESLRVYFLGARPEVVARLVADCREKHPGLVVAGYRDGYFGVDQHERIAREIAASQPHMLFIGMPSPFKEIWAERYRHVLQVPLIIGVGGSFDVLTGYIRRAPRAFQVLGMEWAWRLLMEPRKLWKRYLTTNSQFIWLTAREVWARRSRLKNGPRNPVSQAHP